MVLRDIGLYFIHVATSRMLLSWSLSIRLPSLSLRYPVHVDEQQGVRRNNEISKDTLVAKVDCGHFVRALNEL